ncbi:MAG: cobalamin-dependent protein [Actinomycetes bacterium]
MQTAEPVLTELVYEEYLAALLAGDRARCTALVEELLAADVGLKDLYVHLFQRALYRVGELWERQRVSVAVEHLATAITERLLTLVQARVFSGATREHTIIIACVANEYHDLGGRMVADLCELQGWRGFFLGADTPLPDLLRLIEEQRPALVGLSLSIYFNMPALLEALDAVTAAHPDLPILVGGQAFRWTGLPAAAAYPNVSLIASLNELEQRLVAYDAG